MPTTRNRRHIAARPAAICIIAAVGTAGGGCSTTSTDWIYRSTGIDLSPAAIEDAAEDIGEFFVGVFAVAAVVAFGLASYEYGFGYYGHRYWYHGYNARGMGYHHFDTGNWR